MSNAPILVWFRRDLRLSDHPALTAACAAGGPVIPVFILDTETESQGRAPLLRLDKALQAFSGQLGNLGSRLVLRRGAAMQVLRQLVSETGARGVFWSRLHDPSLAGRDSAVKAGLTADGIAARCFGGHLLHEPHRVRTRQGGAFRVFTPFWKVVSQRPLSDPLPAPSRLPVPSDWPVSDDLRNWGLARGMRRGEAVVSGWISAGEAAARDRLGRFAQNGAAQYATRRDVPGLAGTSGLSDALALGEISPLQCWAALDGVPGAGAFRRQLAWRDFAWHLACETPHMLARNWRDGWDGFGWSTDPDHPHLRAWQQGRTGIRLVDAAMRELYVTGRMHNRCRMIAASYLTKHLMIDWRLGMRWFADCLVDWDPASNAMGWQWVAGTGPDAAPFFRVFNPDTQRHRFDPGDGYCSRWLDWRASRDAAAFFDAVPVSWGLRAGPPPTVPVVGLAEGRARALAAYARLRAQTVQPSLA